MATSQPDDLYVGQTFPSIDAAKQSVLHAMVTHRLSFRVTSSDRTRFHAKCRSSDETGCKFFIRINYMKRCDHFELRRLDPHTCDLSSHQSWKACNSAKLIANRHEDMIKSDFQTRPRQIQNAERLQYCNQISYKQAWRAKQEIKKSTFLDAKKSFQLVLPFLETITDNGLHEETDLDDEGNYATSRANAAISRNDDGSFEWCHVAPRACIHAFWHSRRFICVDGAHMKLDNNLVLLAVTTLDSNEEILPLMWGFARSESKESWLDFLRGFREYFLDSLDTTEKERNDFEYLTIVSDRAKGLVPAVSEAFPKAFHYHCTQHLAENVGNEFGRKVEKVFRAACLVNTKAKFKACLDQVESLSAPARRYLEQIDREHYATSYAPLVDFPRFGQTCSNISESINSAWMEARNLPILHSLHHLWTFLMSKFYERRHKPQKDEKYTNYAMAYFQKELKESSRYIVTPQERENFVAIVYRANPGDQNTRLVQLKAQKCSCLAFQDHKIPCRHAIAVCRFFRVKPEDHIAKFYEISEYREQYKYSLVPVLLDDLEPDGFTKPPPHGLSRGRLIRKRMKRITRESEARRRGNLAPPSLQRKQQSEARNRYQSGTTYAQEGIMGRVNSSFGQPRDSDQSTLPNPLLAQDGSVLNQASVAQPPESRDQDTLWQRIRAMNARLSETGATEERSRAEIAAQIRAVRQAVHENSHPHPLPMPPTFADQLALRPQPPLKPLVSRFDTNQAFSHSDELLQRSRTSPNDPTASQATYIDSVVTTNNVILAASSSTPNVAINAISSSSKGNKRCIASGNQEGSVVEGEDPPALSTRSRKRVRIG